MQGMEVMSVAEISRFIVVSDSELAGIADSQWRIDSLVREGVYCPPGLVLITLIVHRG
jgi:hypothetical protein